EERYRLLVESIADYAICLLDAQGQIMSWNGGAERIFGYPRSEIIGSHLGRLFQALDTTRQLPQQVLDEAARAGTYESEVWSTRRDGSTLLASLLLNVLRDDDGTLRG